MSAEIFLKEIESRKRKELEVLDRELAEKKDVLLRERNSRVEELQERYKKEARLKSERDYTRIVEAARLQARRIIFEAVGTNLDSFLGAIRQELRNYTKNAQYKKTLEEMIDVGRKRLGHDVRVHCRAEDHQILKDLRVTISDKPIQTFGGIIVENKEGTMDLDLTFEELLRTHDEEVRAILLEKG